MLRFLHAADLHLGMKLTRFSADAINRVREARFEALEHVKKEAANAERGYRFVLLAGDVFDDVRVPREIARRTFNILEDFPVPVLIISGNHDPLEPGSVWESEPWMSDSTHRVRVLRGREPVRAIEGVTLFPCPVYRKTSYEDPTAWIAEYPRTPDDGFRIGIAHGSVMDRPTLPENDHPIDPEAPRKLDLDYLALGHWHKPKRFCDGRMAYPGVHEPMRFAAADASGWKPYSPGGERDDFRDDGNGRAFSVTLERPEALPAIEDIPVGRLQWQQRDVELRQAADLNDLIRRVTDEAQQPQLTLLRLSLSGTLPLQAMERLDELEQVLGRYVVYELDTSRLHPEPNEDEIRDVVGGGMLSTVFESIAARSHAEENGDVPQQVAEEALSLLYRYAKQVRE